MKLVNELQPDAIDINIDYELTRTVRVILLNENHKIALLHVVEDDYHKIPGCCIVKDKDKIETLKREIYEETGVTDKSMFPKTNDRKKS